MDITIFVLWAFIIGAVFGVLAFWLVMEIEWRKEQKRLEKRDHWRDYYDFCLWMRRRDKPIDFRIE